MKISRRSVFIIAEAGVNHNGSIETAMKMIETAKVCGADAVKFQSFKADKLVSEKAPLARYQKNNLKSDTSQYNMLKKFEFGEDTFELLSARCIELGIKFMASPFDIDAADFLASIDSFPIKIPSGEITNLPYIEKIGSFGKEIILSTGMSDLGEIEDTLDILIQSGTPIEKICLLHCNTEYPTPFEDVNLNAISTLKHAFPGINIGYSDHTTGIEVSVAAAALGACVIEKHFTLDPDMEGPDHKASLTPDTLKEMVKAVRNIELAMGNGIKKPSPSEEKNIKVVRKSIVASRKIEKGEIFTRENLTTKRPGTGISPMRWYEVMGKKAPKYFEKDDIIEVIL